ncbi:MAG: hypothetical protein V1856_00635, partial [Candidatus Liptonbacteria bacterium]
MINISGNAVTSTIHLLLQWENGTTTPVGASLGFNIEGGISAPPSRINFNSEENAAVDEYVSGKPDGASRLRLTLNDNRAFRENIVINTCDQYQCWTHTSLDDYSNNVDVATPSVRGADLVAENISWNEETGRLTFSVRNIGGENMNIPAETDMKWIKRDSRGDSFYDPIPNSYAGVVKLDASGSRDFVIEGVKATKLTVAGIRIKADRDDRFLEGNEENNFATVMRRNLPDLEVKDVSFGENGLDFKIVNGTDFSVPSSTTENYWWPNMSLQWLDRNGLALGSSTGISLYSGVGIPRGEVFHYGTAPSSTMNAFSNYLRTPPPAASQVRITADSVQNMVEANETNNSASVGKPLPDLVMESARFKRKTGDTQDNLHFEFKMRNIGQYDFTGSAGISLQWLDRNRSPVGEVVTSTVDLSGGVLRGGRLAVIDTESAYDYSDLTRTLRNMLIYNRQSIPRGAYYLKLILDPQGIVAESSRENNEISAELPHPNVAISGSVELTNDMLSFLVHNNGG